MNKHPVTP